MKRLTLFCSALVVAMLLSPAALAAQHQMPGQPPGQPPMMGGGMMGQGMMGMMCPMMHQMMHQMMMGGQMGPGAMMGMMGGQMPAGMDPKTMGRMLQMRGEMFKAMGEIMLKHGKQLEEGK